MNYSESCRQMGYAILQKASEPRLKKMNEAIDFMAKNMTDEQAASISRSLKIMEEGFKNRKPDPYTEKLFNWMEKEMNKQFNKDMIYYSICYDGFRV